MASLTLKPNWDETRAQFRRWWNHEPMDRPLMVLPVEKDGPLAPMPTPPESTEDQWLDTDYLLRKYEAAFARSPYPAESLPYAAANLGPGAFGTYLGCRVSFMPTTVWYDPIVRDVTELDLAYDETRPYWRWTVETTRRFVEAGRGRFLAGIPDMIENLDTLAALVGTERILMDLIEHPAAVHAAQRKLNKLWFRYFDELYEMVEIDGGNAFMAFQIWGPGKTAKLQCDVSAMISPEMFKEFVAPYLDEQSRWLDYSLYHLDGPDALCHLDTILALPELSALQWTPGAGKAPPSDPQWDFIHRRLLDAGKALWVHVDADAARDFVKRFGRQMHMIIGGTFNPHEAKKFIDESATW